MAIRAMMFIDGSWLYHLIPQIRRLNNDFQYKIDYSKIPPLAQGELARQMGLPPEAVYLMRTHIFGPLPVDIDSQDQTDLDTQSSFYNTMSDLYLFETHIHEIPYRDNDGVHRMRARDRRDAGDPWNPKEKCVDMDLAGCMMYFAAMPNSYDIAILVGGDRDYAPLLGHVRRMGKKVMIVGARNSTAGLYISAPGSVGVRDFETVLLDEHLKELELKWEEKEHECSTCGKKFVTDFQPRRYQKVFCDGCRQEHRRSRTRESDRGGHYDYYTGQGNNDNIGNFKRYSNG